MSVRIISKSSPSDHFRDQVINQLAHCPFDGYVIHRAIIPNVQYRNLPDELDIVLFTDRGVYAIDANRLMPGRYREVGGIWEAWETSSEERPAWKPAGFFPDPTLIARRKAEQLSRFLLEKLSNTEDLDVVPVIVVPDDVEMQGWSADGTASTGARLLLAQFSDLVEVLEKDQQRAIPGPSAEEMMRLFSQVGSKAKPYPCYLNQHIYANKRLATLSWPAPVSIFEGYDQDRRRDVRIEVLPLYGSRFSSEELARGFRNNLEALDKIRHPASLQTYNYWSTPVSLVAVSEAFTGVSLNARVAKGPLTWTETAKLFKPVVDLVQQAHQQNVVHRWLHPKCILVPEIGSGRVCVWGFYGSADGILSTMGTKQEPPDHYKPYNAPEQKAHSTQLDALKLRDVYSIGRCLCFALTKDPYRCSSGETPPEVERLITQLVSHTPEDRAEAWAKLPRCLGEAGC